MPEAGGHIELERSTDSIIIGHRHRTDLGDLEPLMGSIEKRGLLQPVTITPEGVLVCGRRRLEAVRRLGWRTLKVWVRSGISDGLSKLLAQQDENTLRKALTPIEQAALFAELKRLMAEDGARRQEASRFGGEPISGEDNGGEDSSPPSPYGGKTRERAALLVSGKLGFQRYEQINALKRIVSDPATTSVVRDLAVAALAEIEAGADVSPAYEKVKAALDLGGGTLDHSPVTTAELEALAEEALARVKQIRARGGSRRRATGHSETPARRTLRAFILTWGDLAGWPQHYDPVEVGEQLTESDWDMFERVLSETQAFADAARRARQEHLERASA